MLRLFPILSTVKFATKEYIGVSGNMVSKSIWLGQETFSSIFFLMEDCGIGHLSIKSLIVFFFDKSSACSFPQKSKRAEVHHRYTELVESISSNL